MLSGAVRRFTFPAEGTSVQMVVSNCSDFFLFGCAVINLLILIHDPIPALLGLTAVLCGDPARRFFFSPQLAVAAAIPRRDGLLKGFDNRWLIFNYLMDFPASGARWLSRPETAKPLNELVEILLHEPNSLTPAERELIATYVSAENDCYYGQTIHGAIAAASLDDDETLVKNVKADFRSAAISNKLKALLVIAAQVQ
jgi:AhpD family alkylhydroperoxidase